MSDFSDRLRLLRQNYNLSQQKLSDEIGTISKSSINMYERGEREPSIETIEAFADFFNVDLAYILGRSDIPNSYKLLDSPAIQHKSKIQLSIHEEKLILAYRSHPEMHDAVDRLLQIEPEASEGCKNA